MSTPIIDELKAAFPEASDAKVQRYLEICATDGMGEPDPFDFGQWLMATDL